MRSDDVLKQHEIFFILLSNSQHRRWKSIKLSQADMFTDEVKCWSLVHFMFIQEVRDRLKEWTQKVAQVWITDFSGFELGLSVIIAIYDNCEKLSIGIFKNTHIIIIIFSTVPSTPIHFHSCLVNVGCCTVTLVATL